MSASPREHGLDQLRQLGGVVLAVAVEPDRELVAVLERVHEARLDGAADPEVEREPNDRRAGRGRELGGAVCGAVVDHDHVEAGSKERISATTWPIAPPRSARERSRFGARVRHGPLLGAPAPTSSSSCRARWA